MIRNSLNYYFKRKRNSNINNITSILTLKSFYNTNKIRNTSLNYNNNSVSDNNNNNTNKSSNISNISHISHISNINLNSNNNIISKNSNISHNNNSHNSNKNSYNNNDNNKNDDYKEIEILLNNLKLKESEEILNKMLKNQVKINSCIFTNIMNKYAEIGLCDDVDRIHNQMIQYNYKPDVVSYTILIKGYGIAERPHDSTNAFREMIFRGIIPNETAVSTLIKVYADNGLPIEGESLLRYSRKFYQIELSIQMYHPIIQGFSQLSLPKDSERLLDEMIHFNIVESNSFGLVIDAYANMKQIDDCERIYNKMKSLNIQPSLFSLNLLLKSYSNCNLPEKAELLLNEMIELNTCDIYSFNTTMTSFSNINQPEKTEIIYRKMLKYSYDYPSLNIQPTDSTYQILLSSYLYNKQYSDFNRLFHKLIPRKYIPKPFHSRHLLILLSNIISPSKLESFLLYLQSNSISNSKSNSISNSIDISCYQVVIKVYLSHKKPDESYRILNNFLNFHLQGDNDSNKTIEKSKKLILEDSKLNKFDRENLLIVYNLIIQGYCSIYEPHNGEKLLNEMRLYGILPNIYTYSSLINAYCKLVSLNRKKLSEHSNEFVNNYSNNINQNNEKEIIYFQRINHLISEFNRYHIPYNSYLYSTIIKYYILKNDLNSLSILLNNLQFDEIEWDEVLYGQVTLSYALYGQIDTVEELYYKMIYQNFEPNSYIYSNLIIASKRSKNLEKAKEWYDIGCKHLQSNEKRDKQKIENDVYHLKTILDREERLLNCT